MTPPIHICNQIRKHLTAQKRSVAWLSQQLGCDPSALRKTLKKPYISTDLLYRISELLDKDFFVYYSRRLGEK